MTENTTTRRGLLKAVGAVIAAPAIVRISSIMPVSGGSIYRATNPWWTNPYDGYWDARDEAMIRLLQQRITDAERVFQEHVVRHWNDLWRQPNTERMIKLLESIDDDQDAGSTP